MVKEMTVRATANVVPNARAWLVGFVVGVPVVGAGVDVVKKKSTTDVEGVSDMYERNIVQPLLVSTSAVTLATETVCMILKVDDMIVVQ